MSPYIQLIGALCASLQIEPPVDSDVFILETSEHHAATFEQESASGDPGLLVRVSVRSLICPSGEDMADTLSMLHRLNHDARSMSPWRILLDENDELFIQQWCALNQIDADSLQSVLTDGLDRAQLLESLLTESLTENTLRDVAALSGSMIFG